MRFFVTGASGFIGSAVVPELLGAGHEVLGLARSDRSAAALEAAGVGVHRGALDDLDSLRAGAEATDGVIHLAYIHDDFNAMEHAMQVDRAAVVAMLEALEGTDKPFAIASGTIGVAPGRVGTEADGLDVDPAGTSRPATARFTLDAAARGVRPIILRFPPTVHGEGDGAFVAAVVALARETGVSGYIGDGAVRWSAVHRLDAARAVRLAVETAPAGTVIHAVAEGSIPTREIAEVVGRGLGLPTASIDPDRAREHFGWLAWPLGADAPVTSERTRALLGWEPTGPTLFEDLEAGHYYRAPVA
jgi:nucleoside-diphosphate-sugar epimerase